VDTHLDLAIAYLPNHLDIGSAGHSRGTQYEWLAQIYFGNRLIDHASHVRIADRDRQSVESPIARLDGSIAHNYRGPHIHGELSVRFRAHRSRPGTGRDRDVWPYAESFVNQEFGEYANAIPAHLSDAAVSVAVIHEPLGSVTVGVTSGSRAPNHTEHPIGTDPEVPVA